MSSNWLDISFSLFGNDISGSKGNSTQTVVFQNHPDLELVANLA